MTVKSALLKTGVIALCCGIGLGLVALAGIAYSVRPTEWNEKAITASFGSAEFNLKPSPAAYYTYSLTNNTNKDFSTKLLGEKHLPDNLRAATIRGPVYDTVAAMPKKPERSALNFGAINFYTEDTNMDESIDQLANGEPLFIPANRTVKVCLRWELPSEDLTKYGSVKIFNTSLLGFVLYDDTTKYQINFPKPSLLQGTQTDLDVKESDSIQQYAPDRGKPWERYAACAEGQKLLPSCREGKFAPDHAKAIAAGWEPVGPLLTLPTIPKGAILEPGEQVCKAVFEWDSYCRKQMK